jgi:hypothetical protein
MKKNHVLPTVLLSIVFALLTIVLLTPVASAHTTASAHEAATSLAPTALPNVNIVRENGRSVFSSSTIHCKAQGLQSPCFTITNLTDKNQRVLFKGKILATLQPGETTEIGVSGAGVSFDRLQANQQALLTVIAS